MFKESYTPRHRGFDEHMGYYQGCESAYTHIAACCSAGSPTGDKDFVCDNGEGQYLGACARACCAVRPTTTMP